MKDTIERDGVWLRPSPYGEDPFPITRALIEDSERLHARVARLDRHRRSQVVAATPVASLQGRIAQAFATG